MFETSPPITATITKPKENPATCSSTLNSIHSPSLATPSDTESQE
jgi:hypothetical protein